MPPFISVNSLNMVVWMASAIRACCHLRRATNEILFAYTQPKPDLAALAAAYAFGIIKNHPFVDGNKRTAYVLCRTFLKLNGKDIDATEVEKYQTVVAVTDGSLSEEQFAEWIRSKLEKI